MENSKEYKSWKTNVHNGVVCGVKVDMLVSACWYHEPEDDYNDGRKGRDEWNLYIPGFRFRVRVIELTDNEDNVTGKYTAISYNGEGEFLDMGLEDEEDKDVVFNNAAQAINYVMDKLFGPEYQTPITMGQLNTYAQMEGKRHE